MLGNSDIDNFKLFIKDINTHSFLDLTVEEIISELNFVLKQRYIGVDKLFKKYKIYQIEKNLLYLLFYNNNESPIEKTTYSLLEFKDHLVHKYKKVYS